MTGPANGSVAFATPRRTGQRLLIGVAIAAGLGGLALANLHLVYVAVSSQPACVEHAKSPGTAPSTYRAAKSAC